jgi:alpha-2-macroglobulin
MGLDVSPNGLTLGTVPSGFDLGDKAKAVFEVPVTAGAVGIQTIDVSLTTPDGKQLKKTLTIPVQVNDPEVARISRLDLAAGQSFTFDDNVFAGLVEGSGKATMAIGPIARLNAPGLLASLDRYPFGCTEQMTSRALPLLYFDEMAQVMDLKGADNLQKRIDEALVEILANQSSTGGFGLWGPGEGDFWLDAYVTDFLSRANAQGYAVPDIAFRNALANLRNQVNYAPDFSAETNGGGEALAYALMVLAREGAAAVGDLRYYADVKGDDFSTPIAQAQLGAALGLLWRSGAGRRDVPQGRGKDGGADGPETEQLWRVDYGTRFRDAAALLTLAVEAGSNAIDREALTDRIATQGNVLSTQEATWALLAANALIDRPGADGITIDGQPADGPLVRVLDAGAVTPVVVRNDGPDTTLTVTTFGVPSEPEPAGGNGYAITRTYYTMDGQEVSVATVSPPAPGWLRCWRSRPSAMARRG